MRRGVAAFVLVLATSGIAGAADEVVNSRFERFCGEWMQKLAVRERDNRAGIHWQVGPSGVQGEYIGYSQEHTCLVKPNPDPKAVPIGKIIYREVQYRQAGPSTAEAQRATPQPVDATEITEIFRYAAGKWVY